MKKNNSPSLYVYVDQYRNIDDDVIAACILSTRIPGVTGPALGTYASNRKSIIRASNQLQLKQIPKTVVLFTREYIGIKL